MTETHAPTPAPHPRVARAEAERAEHRSFLNKYYGLSRHIYDLTRKYYLFGRDAELRALLDESWSSLVEVGPGTGRNLRKLRRKRRDARFGGLEASDAMLTHARRKCPWAKFEQGFAESADLSAVLGEPPDRILYSYCLSMVTDREGALENSIRSLSPGGAVALVDFGDFGSLPDVFETPFRRWLEAFHVDPVSTEMLEDYGATIEWGPGRYFFRARISRD